MLSAACCLLQCCLLHAVCCMLSAACCLLHVVCCMPSVACCLLAVHCPRCTYPLHVGCSKPGSLQPPPCPFSSLATFGSLPKPSVPIHALACTGPRRRSVSSETPECGRTDAEAGRNHRARRTRHSQAHLLPIRCRLRMSPRRPRCPQRPESASIWRRSLCGPFMDVRRPRSLPNAQE